MRVEESSLVRSLKTETIKCDLCVTGGGIAGVACAVTAARAGIATALIQDRPVLGGNASSEIRVWISGATAHMGSNNRWSREGGLINELLLENCYKNKGGNPVVFDSILLDKVLREEKITLLLNTAVFEVVKSDAKTISSVKAFCPQNSTMYLISAPLFCDASGDGIVGYLSGAAYRIGAEDTSEFNETMAPDDSFGRLLGQSLYFNTKKANASVDYYPPSFAHLCDEIENIPRHKQLNPSAEGCHLWWLEYGGRLDPVHDTEKIKRELWKISYGVYNYYKNSKRFLNTENRQLEWMGAITGKRESRRFEGDYILSQNDLLTQKEHCDAVSYGGWSIDLHPADGIYDKNAGSIHGYISGIYQIPFRTMYSRNINNLFLAGRLISASHVAFGSTRVMATCAHSAQAVGTAAAICVKKQIVPRDLIGNDYIAELQRELIKSGQYIPGYKFVDKLDMVATARLSASSSLATISFPDSNKLVALCTPLAQLVPATMGCVPQATFIADVEQPTKLEIEIRISKKRINFTPAITLARKELILEKGKNIPIVFDFPVILNESQYLFYCFGKNDLISLHATEKRITGVLTVRYNGTESHMCLLGFPDVEMWVPERRPDGFNLAGFIGCDSSLFSVNNITNGINRPLITPNAWVAALDDVLPWVKLEWNMAQKIRRVQIEFDSDYDHSLESVNWEHSDSAMPFCVKSFIIVDERGCELYKNDGNYQGLLDIVLDRPVVARSLTIKILEIWGNAPAAIFAIRCYSE